jgi:hypothetical protein
MSSLRSTRILCVKVLFASPNIIPKAANSAGSQTITTRFAKENNFNAQERSSQKLLQRNPRRNHRRGRKISRENRRASRRAFQENRPKTTSPDSQSRKTPVSALQRAAIKWGMAGILWGNKFSIATTDYGEKYYRR